jgi:glyoxylase-like metal-dependent hydrolase (beta-lactamase superfamily II)
MENLMRPANVSAPLVAALACSLALVPGCAREAAPAGTSPDAPAAAAAPAPLTAQAFVAGPGGFHVTSTLILGEHDALLVDAQFLDSEAKRLVDTIRASGKHLSTIYITHAHPDHFFGLAVVHAAFPDARILAHSTVAAEMHAAWQPKHDEWKPRLGADLSDTPVDATAHDAPTLELEGHTLQLIGPEQGDAEHVVSVYVPELKTLIASDVSYGGVYPWVADAGPEGWNGWLATLARLQALGATTVISGHRAPDHADSPADLEATAGFLRAFRDAAPRAASADALVATMHAAYPDLALPIVLTIGASAAIARHGK